jgi:ubiquinone/menaquinone biosynthesis C-methylase UbiE
VVESSRDRRLRRSWDRQAQGYDRMMTRAEQRWFGDTRPWLCAQAAGRTLEVAAGTGLNLAYYPAEVELTALEWSEGMLAVARQRATELRRDVDLRHGDARALDFPAACFDTVVCTFALCGIPQPKRALGEMARVLRPGGRLLLADHVASSVWPVYALQLLVDAVGAPLTGEHFARRPIRWLPALGFAVEADERSRLGIIERVVARRTG